MKSQIDELIQYYQDHHFTNFIKGKRVIIVGPDTALKGQKRGKFIDSFDLVVRHNTVFEYLPFTPKLARDYGTRTDLLYLAPTCLKTYATPRAIPKFKKAQIQYIAYQNGNRDSIYFLDQYCYPKSLNYLKKVLNTKKNPTKLHYSHRTARVLSQIMTENAGQPLVPRTGFISIIDMIVHQAKEVQTIGMSFYCGGGHAFRPDSQSELDPLKNHCGKKSGHDSLLELELMKQLKDKLYPDKLLMELPQPQPQPQPQPDQESKKE